MVNKGFGGFIVEFRKPNGDILSTHKIFEKDDLVLLHNIAEKGIDVLGVGLDDYFPTGDGNGIAPAEDLMYWFEMWTSMALDGQLETL